MSVSRPYVLRLLGGGLAGALACAAPTPEVPRRSPPDQPPPSTPVRTISRDSPSLPSPEAIFDRALASVGGPEAVAALPGYRGRARFTSPAGLEGEMVVLVRAPDRVRTTLVIEPGWSFEEGYDGAVAWTVDPTHGPRARSTTTAVALPEPFALARHRTRYPERRTVGPERFGGAPAWAVEVRTPGGRTERHYFHRTTGRALGLTRRLEGLAFTATYADWVQVGPVRMPGRIVHRIGEVEQTLVFEELVPEAVPEEAFTPPRPIRGADGPAARAPPRPTPTPRGRP